MAGISILGERTISFRKKIPGKYPEILPKSLVGRGSQGRNLQRQCRKNKSAEKLILG